MKNIIFLLLLVGSSSLTANPVEVKPCVGAYDSLTWTDGCSGSYKKGPITKQGFWQDGFLDGEGTYIHDDGTIYKGTFKNDDFHGKGTYEYSSGQAYIGDFKYNSFHGEGKMTWPNGDIYEGGYRFDSQNGFGAINYSDGDKYIGEYQDDMRHGKGTYTWSDGRTYSGYWLNDLKDGEGHMNWPDGTKYIGEYQDNMRHGKGTYTWSDGRIYEGNWLYDNSHGNGSLTWPDGTQYAGEWAADNMHGEGIYTYEDGRIYSGEFKYDFFDGKGTLSYPNNDKYEGQFKDDKKHGNGIFTYNNGLIEEGIWDYDELIKDSEINTIANNHNSEGLREASSGTGFMVSRSGHIVTNYHVIEHCEKIKVRNIDISSIEAQVLAKDEINDLVVLKADIESSQVLPISKSNPENLQEIFVAGFPFGTKVSNSLKFTNGIISALTGIGDNLSDITIDAAINPGNSGGPIVNLSGAIVGVTKEKLDANAVMKETGYISENTNFGIKSKILSNLLLGKGIDIEIAQSSEAIPRSELGKLLTATTYFVGCEMTVAQIKKLQTQKVMYGDLLK